MRRMPRRPTHEPDDEREEQMIQAEIVAPETQILD